MSRDELPRELADVDGALRGVAFQPRASLGPEILGRLRRGEAPARRSPPRAWRPAMAALAAGLVLVSAGALALRGAPSVQVDRCCYDLDGGGDADDGVVVRAERDAKVHRLRVYEDLDRTGTFTPGDLVRLERGDSPAMRHTAVKGLVTTEHCCVDFDGGGPADDGLVVIGVPPDRVVMAAIYERGASADTRAGRPDGYLLR